MADEETPKLKKVPEVILKKRKQVERLAKERVAERKAKREEKRNAKAKPTFKRAEHFVKNQRKTHHDEKRVRRVERALHPSASPSPKLALVYRLNGSEHASGRAKKILKILRLKHVNSAVFVKMTEPTIAMLKLVEPYVTYGKPDLQIVTDLIYKRGFSMRKKKKQPLTDNAAIEKALGNKGIICVEDIVHEIYTVGSGFEAARTYLLPFTFDVPTKGWRKKTAKDDMGRETGDRRAKINDLVKQLI